jgi:hypothetical protein
VRWGWGFVAEKILNFFGAVWFGRQENFDCLTKCLQSGIGGFGSLQAIQISSEAEASPAHFEKMLIENFFCHLHGWIL